MSKKKKTAIAALIVLGIVAVGLAAGVYAKYIASLTKTGGAEIAKWVFETENTNSNFDCTLTDTYVSGAIRTENGKVIIAPGTKGECVVKLSNEQSDVAVDYKITADATASTVPTNLKLTGDGNTATTLGSFVKTGTLAIGAKNKEVKIGWEWPYETGDDVSSGAIVDNQKSGDTVDNSDASKTTMTLSFKIQGIQKKPTAN